MTDPSPRGLMIIYPGEYWTNVLADWHLYSWCLAGRLLREVVSLSSPSQRGFDHFYWDLMTDSTVSTWPNDPTGEWERERKWRKQNVVQSNSVMSRPLHLLITKYHHWPVHCDGGGDGWGNSRWSTMIRTWIECGLEVRFSGFRGSTGRISLGIKIRIATEILNDLYHHICVRYPEGRTHFIGENERNIDQFWIEYSRFLGKTILNKNWIMQQTHWWWLQIFK